MKFMSVGLIGTCNKKGSLKGTISYVNFTVQSINKGRPSTEGVERKHKRDECFSHHRWEQHRRSCFKSRTRILPRELLRYDNLRWVFDAEQSKLGSELGTG